MVGKSAGPGFDEALLVSMVLMTLADGRVAEDELTRIRWIYGKVSDEDISEEQVRIAIARVRSDGSTMDEHLSSVAPGLGDGEKRRMLKAAFAIASADGRVVDEEDELLRRIAKGLAISPETYRAVLSHMSIARDLV